MIRFLVLLCVGLVISYGYALLNGVWPFEGMSPEQRGLFGDSWGAFTSVFSALGFCGVLWTIRLQISATKKIEQDSRKREESEKLRDFENSFFNMLSILQTIIKDMRVNGDVGKKNREGRSVFTYFYSQYKNDFVDKNITHDIAYIDESKFSVVKERQKIAISFDYFFRGRNGNFSHYYRYLYNIFRFIDESSIDGMSKCKYAKILRAQISNYELMILFYNGVSKHGSNFIVYLERYHVFDNLPTDKLISDVHVLFYDKKVWGENTDALNIYNKAYEKGIK